MDITLSGRAWCDLEPNFSEPEPEPELEPNSGTIPDPGTGTGTRTGTKNWKSPKIWDSLVFLTNESEKFFR